MSEPTRLVTAGNNDPAGPPVHENNVWLVGDEHEVLVIDPAHDARAVADAVAGRRVVAVLLTHGHWDHVRAAPAFAALVGDPPVHLAPADRFLWRQEHRGVPVQPLTDGDVFEAGGVALRAVATPGHTPGSTCLWAPDLCTLFSGDTLFPGGPGATRWCYSDFARILDSIERRLLPLGDDVVVHPGHGESTTIGAERPHLEDWRARGW